MRLIRVVLGFIAALPVCWFVGALVANQLLNRRFVPVDLDKPPAELAVVAAWVGPSGEARCRIFYRRNLVRYADSLPDLRYDLSDSDMAVCSASVDAFRRDRRWPDAFPWDRPMFAAAARRLDAQAPRRFEVAYMFDDDRFAMTRYRVDPATGDPSDFEFRGYFGPARGIGLLLFGGAGGSLLWLALVIWYVHRRLARRREASMAAKSDLEAPLT